MEKGYKYDIKNRTLITPKETKIYLTNREIDVLKLLIGNELVTINEWLSIIPQYRASIFRFRKKTHLKIRTLNGIGYVLLDKVEIYKGEK